MKKKIALLALCSLAFLPAQAAEKSGPRMDKGGNWKFDTFAFEAKKGIWDNARAWQGGFVPNGELPRVNVMGGTVLTINKPTGTPLSSIHVGFSPKKTEVYFETGAQLSAGSFTMPGRYAENGDAVFHMQGGELTVGDLKETQINEALGIGSNMTFSGKAHFIISGGTLSAGLRVGSSAPNTNVGTFSVRGSLPVIKGHNQPRGNVFVLNSGTLEFILDDKGVATMDYRKTFLALHEGASILVDGRAYKGDSKTFVLFQADNIRKLGTVNTQVTGFSSNYAADIVIEKSRIVLKVQRKGR